MDVEYEHLNTFIGSKNSDFAIFRAICCVYNIFRFRKKVSNYFFQIVMEYLSEIFVGQNHHETGCSISVSVIDVRTKFVK